MRPGHDRRSLPEHGDQRRAFGQDLAGIVGGQADQLLAVAAGGVAARQRATAEKVLVAGDERAEPKIDRRHRAVGFLSDDDVALLGPHDMHRLGAVRGDAEGLADGDQPFPQFQPLIGRYIDLVTQLAREADPEDARGDTADVRLAHRHLREGGSVEREARREKRQHIARRPPD